MTSKAQQKANEKYEATRFTKRVSFNNKTEADLLAKMEKIQADTGLSFSEWVKKQIEIAQ